MKPFDQGLYDNNDWVKHLFVDVLNASEVTNARINPNQYGIDIVSDNWDFEVEIKHNWNGKEFPYDTMHYANRKRKFLSVRAFFVTFNSQATRYFITHSTAFAWRPLIIKGTTLTEREEFIVVPIESGQFHDVPDKLRKAYP